MRRAYPTAARMREPVCTTTLGLKPRPAPVVCVTLWRADSMQTRGESASQTTSAETSR